jgi:hypothetical protein
MEAREAPEPEARRADRHGGGGGSGQTVRLGAIVALAVAVGVVVWVLVGRSDDSDSGQPAVTATAPLATTPAPSQPQAASRPTLESVAQLRAAAAASAVPLYWAGPRAGTRLEFSQVPGVTSFVRYLPKGTPAGALQPFLTVATYARPNGFTEIQAAAKNPKAETIDLADGGLAVYDPSVPTNVHLAYPDDAYQIEVFSPDAGVALRLVSNGKIRPVR